MPLRKRSGRKRKCKHCHEYYVADPRNRRQQRYCCKPQCRHASKAAAQRRWQSSEKGRDYFKGAENVRHVQRWRAAHPGYWKRAKAKVPDALQDLCSLQPVESKSDTPGLNLTALQDVWITQPAFLIGLIASLTGTTLQDEIAETSRRFIVSGRDILGMDPGCPTKGGRDGG